MNYIFLAVNNQQGKFFQSISQAFKNWKVLFSWNFIKKCGSTCKNFVSYLLFICFFIIGLKNYLNILSCTDSQLLFRNFLIRGSIALIAKWIASLIQERRLKAHVLSWKVCIYSQDAVIRLIAKSEVSRGCIRGLWNLYTYKTLITLFVCLRPCVHSKILGLSPPVMIVSNLDTIEFIFN